jgi:dTDP-4-dehydrorhamnose 3,5-epimerase-like enzyme
MATMDKVFLEMLPVTNEGDGAKRWTEEKGEFAQICYGEEARHIALFTLRKGFWRGMHYHEKKEETFYVACGSVRAVFIDMDTDERVEHLLTKGVRLHVLPRCWHIFYGIDEATVVEYSPQVYESKDAYRIDMGAV